MYGLGEMHTPGTLSTRSMGGVGVAVRGAMGIVPGGINLLNPAAHSSAVPKSLLFDLGVEGTNFYNAQRQNGELLRTSNTTFNFHDIAIQVPLAKGLGMGFSLTPYSSTGYRMRREVEDPLTWGEIGRVQQQWDGDGDVTEVKLGIGWEIFKGFSLGVAGQYYWGGLDRTYRMSVLENIVGGGVIASAVGTERYTISRFKGQVGLQWSPILNRERRRMLTIGATYDLGGDLHPRYTRRVETDAMLANVAMADTTRREVRLPQQIAAGVFYATSKVGVGVDYVYRDWGRGNSQVDRTVAGVDVRYVNTSTVKLGFEYTPNRTDIRNMLKRWSYRAGARYGTFHQTFGGRQVDEYAVTLGLGIPLRKLNVLGASSVDVGVEFGQRGSLHMLNQGLGMVRQMYFKFAVGVTLFGEDYWFMRPKYD